MKKWILILILLVTMVGCTKADPGEIPPGEITPSPGLPTPEIQTTSTPDQESVVISYLESWEAGNYSEMYKLLTPESKTRISEEDFENLYWDVAVELALADVSYSILSSYIDPSQAQVAVNLVYNSRIIEDLSRDVIFKLILQNGDWKIDWSKQVIFPELEGDNVLKLNRVVPVRGNIYDREGSVIVANSDALSLGLTPSQIKPKKENDLLEQLSRVLDVPAGAIAAEYADYPPNVDWYLPLGAVSLDEVEGRYGILQSYTDSGLLLREFSGRYYFDGGVSPQAIGYVRWIQEAEEDNYRLQGYSRDEKVGGQGIERWGEEYLAGDRGGTLYVEDAAGETVAQLASSQAGPAQEIYTTFEKEFQVDVQQALYGYNGAIVVMELDTGRVLAMASNPAFDPNAFNSNYYNSNILLQEYYKADQKSPFLNRATQGLYPLGSVFKIITMAAGLESGEFEISDQYDCGYFFEELDGVVLNDWTYDHFLEDDETPPSGVLTLSEGLMRSCNPYFWHIGLDLFRKGQTDAVAEMAAGFGLGQLTGIEGVEEEPGLMPVPQTEIDATNLAIGQGQSQVTPLQVARFIAAVGNGGTLYRPQIIESIRTSGGEEIFAFEPDPVGELPVSNANLQSIRNAMVQVVENPRGTAYYRFRGLQIPVAGKTGTAESGSGESHAWFAGYTNNQNPNKPDIAVVVIAENAGEGSEVAAPIFRRVVELYFNQILRYYPWESEIGVWAVPEPEENGDS